jgi:alpha-galactosidase
MHGRWWANDPDCLVLRDADTGLDEAERRFLATAVALSGGLAVASDAVRRLSPASFGMLRALLPSNGMAARAEAPGDGPVPAVWRAAAGDGRFLLGILNWSDQPRWAGRDEILRPGEIAFDVWNGRLAGMGDVLLRPHEGLLWQVSATGSGPRVVGDSASVTYARLGIRQVSGQLQVVNELQAARTIAVESRGQVFEVDLVAGERRWFQ